MAEVTLVINDRSYDVACDDGQESHLQDLAAHINERIQDLAESVGQVGETLIPFGPWQATQVAALSNPGACEPPAATVSVPRVAR